MNSEALLRLKGVTVRYGGVTALEGVDISLDEGEVVALMGPNGAGKSTVIKSIFGLAPVDAGAICWHEREFKPIPHNVVRRGISYVPQGRRVFKHLSVRENLELGGWTIKGRGYLKERIGEVLEIFPALKVKLNNKSSELSGGQQQMLAIARGLIPEPKVLLLDEPSLGLSPKLVKETFAKIKEINVRHKTAIMVVEHNIRSLFEFVDRAYLLNNGKVVTEDTPNNLLNSDILERVFLGKA